MENDIEVPVEETQAKEVIEEVAQPSVEELQKKIDELTSQKEHWREKASKVVEKPVQKYESAYSAGDLLAIQQAKLTEAEDVDKAEWFAKAKGIPFREALNDPEFKAIINLRQEQRNSAIASNVDSVRRGVVKITDDTLLQNAQMGKIPTADDEIERLVHIKSKRH